MKRVVLGLVLIAVSLMPPSNAWAVTPAEGINLQISPLPISLTAKPGSAVTTDLRVRNAGSQTEKLELRLLKVSEDDRGLVHLSDAGPRDEFAGWVSFDRQTFEAPPDAWQTIKMTIKLPRSAAFGYYFAVEYLRADQQAPQAGKAVANGAVATFILLNADAPGAKREARVVSFTADHKSYEFLPASFTVKVRSTGNVHVAPHGNIFISRGGKQVGSITINEAEGNVLPGGSRYFSASWQDGFPVYQIQTRDGQPVTDRSGQPVQNLRWDFTKADQLRFGRYTAHLVMVYDNGQRDVPLEASVQFWVMPWRILAVGLVIIALIGLGIWSVVRKSTRLVRRHTKRSAKKVDR